MILTYIYVTVKEKLVMLVVLHENGVLLVGISNLTKDYGFSEEKNKFLIWEKNERNTSWDVWTGQLLQLKNVVRETKHDWIKPTFLLRTHSAKIREF